MKLEAIKLGLSVTAACTLALAPVACDGDGGDSADTVAATGDGTADSGEDEEDGGNTETGEADDEADGSADDGSGDDGPTGMGEDPPTFDCASATGTLDKKFFTVSDEFNDVMMLDGISVINGNVDIDSTNYNNLDFLNCITAITGTLTIFGNDFLVDASGLNNLETLGGTYGGDFVFSKNNAITNFNGLDKLETVETSPNPDFGMPGCSGATCPAEFFHSIVMNDNESLEEINGFAGLLAVFGNITIRDNPVLQHIDGLQGLLALGKALAITHNPELCLSSVNAVGSQIQQPCIVGPPACEPQVDPPSSWTTTANNTGC